MNSCVSGGGIKVSVHSFKYSFLGLFEFSDVREIF